jgi:heptaprenyl diphosphate synthase
MAGIPLTSGFTGKWAVFTSAAQGGAWPLVVIAVLLSVVAAFFYLRVIVRRHRGRLRGHRAARGAARAGPRPGGERGVVHPVTEDEAPGLALPVLDRAMEARLRDRMVEIETRLEREIRSEAPFITEACRHLLRAGGKRFRPLLVLLAAETGNADAPGVATAACVVELTHLASLYHDDVMDEASLRRGADSANARWDNHVAILAGDWLFSKSSELTSQLGPEAVRIQAETFTRLVEGQILETQPPAEGQPLLDHYLRVVRGKTGSLIATSARYGAMFAGAPAEVVAALTEYGEKIGCAFQLSDDILDVGSESDESGKTPGTDLREGVRTLPTLLAMRSQDPADGRLLELLSGPLTDDAPHAEALGLLRAHPAMDEARAYVLELAQEATEVLAVLPEGPVKEALVAFADLIATRTA